MALDPNRPDSPARDRPPARDLAPWVRALMRSFPRYVGALAIVLVSTGCAEMLYHLTSDTRLSLVFLAGVLAAAVLLGAGPGYLAAATAFLIYNYDLVDPRFTLSMGTAEDFITLIVFLLVAVAIGHLTTRIRRQAARAQARAETTDVLFEATREFAAASEEAYIRARLAHYLAAAAKGQALVRDGSGTHSEPAGAEVPRQLLLEAAAMAREPSASAVTQSYGEWTLRPLQAGEAVLGVAAWRPLRRYVLRPEELRLLEILADAGAAAIARARLAAAKTEAETRARTEDLRNALLSSISHDMRTPLAAIMVSASSLRRYGANFDDAIRADLASTIEEETARLDAFVANLLNMTRLEAGALVAQMAPFSVAEVVERTVGRRNTAQRPVVVSIAPGLQDGAGDPLLFEQALGNVVENALRYTPDGHEIRVSARPQADRIVVEVVDEGPGVPRQDLARIFEKFFRSRGTAHQPGTGLGLSIARGLMESMGGSVRARGRADGRSGLMVTLDLRTTV